MTILKSSVHQPH